MQVLCLVLYRPYLVSSSCRVVIAIISIFQMGKPRFRKVRPPAPRPRSPSEAEPSPEPKSVQLDATLLFIPAFPQLTMESEVGCLYLGPGPGFSKNVS